MKAIVFEDEDFEIPEFDFNAPKSLISELLVVDDKYTFKSGPLSVEKFSKEIIFDAPFLYNLTVPVTVCTFELKLL